jgi:hypothetical protein
VAKKPGSGECSVSNRKQVKNNFLLDFDEWMVLAKNNPDEFEKKRREHIEIFIEGVPQDKQRRLKGLQWKIDQIRKLSRTPMASCIEISNMMWDSMIRLKDCHYQLVDIATNQSDKVLKKDPVSATVIEIGSRAH